MYLAKRGATYYFRRVVPDELQPFIPTTNGKPRTEFMQSLGTKELAVAKRLLGPAITASQAALDHAQARLEASKVPPLPRTPVTPQMAYEWWAEQQRSDDAFEDHRAMLEREGLREQIRNLVRNQTDLSPELLALRDMLPVGELDDLATQAQRDLQRELEYSQAAKASVPVWLKGRSGAASTTPASITAAFEGYVSERKPAASTVKRWRPVISHLVKHLGHDDAAKVTGEDVVAWKNALRKEILPNGKQRSARTISEAYLPAARVTFEYARENRQIGENPADAITILVPPRVLTRDDLGFSDGEAAVILRAALAQAQLPETLSTRARQWLPWLCAYTGARVNELTPLLGQEVLMVDGVWTIHITPGASSDGDNSDAGTSQRTVKTHRARRIPIHPHLIDLGFIRAIQAAGHGPFFYDPGKARSGKAANPQHKKVAERLGAWVRSLGVTDPQIKPSHAWRHLFITLARDAGMTDPAIYAITGHAQKTEGTKYGRYKPKVLLRELQKLPRFEP